MDEGLERSSPLLKTEKDFMSLKGDKPKAVDLDSLVDGDLGTCKVIFNTIDNCQLSLHGFGSYSRERDNEPLDQRIRAGGSRLAFPHCLDLVQWCPQLIVIDLQQAVHSQEYPEIASHGGCQHDVHAWKFIPRHQHHYDSESSTDYSEHSKSADHGDRNGSAKHVRPVLIKRLEGEEK
jgi:hypothetical protein